MEDERFPDFDAINKALDTKASRLLDINHATFQDARREIERINAYRNRYNDVCDEMCEALAIGARMMADITGDMISDEYGVVNVNELEDEDEEDEDE